VAADGSFGNSKGVARVSPGPVPGLYCFNLTFTPQVAVACPEATADRIALTRVPGSPLCPEAFRDANVVIHDLGGAPDNFPFYVVFE
jgi:hypothetical protein